MMKEWKQLYQHYAWPFLGLMMFFVLGVFIGLVLPAEWKKMMLYNIGILFDSILEGQTTTWQMMLAIFLNNLRVALILFLGGFILIVPIVALLMNGVMVGVFLSLLFRVSTIEPGSLLSGIVMLIPHGVFELTAIFLAGSFSMSVVFKSVLHRHFLSAMSRMRFLIYTLAQFIVVCIPLLAIAAVVEVSVSRQLATRITDILINDDRFDDTLKRELNTAALIEYQCVTGYQPYSFEDSDRVSSSLNTLSTLIYTPTLYAMLQQKAELPYWNVTYRCNHFTLTVTTYASVDWSLTQASAYQQQLYEALILPYEHVTRGSTEVFTVEQPDTPALVALQHAQGVTLMLSSDNRETPLDEFIEFE